MESSQNRSEIAKQEHYEQTVKSFVKAISGLSLREAESRTRIKHTTIAELIEEERTGQYSTKRHAGTVRKMERFVQNRKRKETRPDPLAADLARIYEEFDTPEDRLLARENLAAIVRARAIEKEVEAAQRRADALEREARAADRRAEAQRLAERRAYEMVCRTTKPGGDGQGSTDPREPTEEAAG